MQKEEKFEIRELIWLFVFGGLLGFILEQSFYVIKYHEYVSKQGLIFGPFKPIYGFGAILFTLIYYLVKKKSKIKLFLVGVLIGSLFEYVSSWIIETIYHSYVWDYSNFKYNINGRIYLPYCIAWGIISLLWGVFVYPFFKTQYNKYKEKKHFKIITLIMTIFMIFNCLFTWTVLLKETTKNKNSNFYKIVDKMYPHRKVVKKFPKFRSLN